MAFKKLLASMGVGGASVETVLKSAVKVTDKLPVNVNNG